MLGGGVQELNFREAIREMKKSNKETIGYLPSVYLKIIVLIETNIKLAQKEGLSETKIGWATDAWFYVWEADKIRKNKYCLSASLNREKRREFINKLEEHCKQKGLIFWARWCPPTNGHDGNIYFWVSWKKKKKRKNFDIEAFEREEKEYRDKEIMELNNIQPSSSFPRERKDRNYVWSNSYGWISKSELSSLS